MSISLDSRLLQKVLGGLLKGRVLQLEGLAPEAEAVALKSMRGRAGLIAKDLPIKAGGLGVKEGITRTPIDEQLNNLSKKELKANKVRNTRPLQPTGLAKELAQQGKRKEDWKGKPVLSRQAERDAEDAIERGFDEGYGSSTANQLSALKSSELAAKAEQYKAAKGEDPSPEMMGRWRREWYEKAKEEGRLGYRVIGRGQPQVPALNKAERGVKSLQEAKQAADAGFLSFEGRGRSPQREAAFQEKMRAGRALGDEAEQFRNVVYSIMQNSSDPEKELGKFLRKYPAAAKALLSKANTVINKNPHGINEGDAALIAKAFSRKERSGPKFAARVALGDSVNMSQDRPNLSMDDRKMIRMRQRAKADSLFENTPPPIKGKKAFTNEQEFLSRVLKKSDKVAEYRGNKDRVAPGGKSVPGTFYQPPGVPNPRPYRDRKTGKEYPDVSEQGKAAIRAQKMSDKRVGEGRASPVAGLVRRLGQAMEKFRKTDPSQVAELAQLRDAVQGGQGSEWAIQVLRAMGYQV